MSVSWSPKTHGRERPIEVRCGIPRRGFTWRASPSPAAAQWSGDRGSHSRRCARRRGRHDHRAAALVGRQTRAAASLADLEASAASSASSGLRAVAAGCADAQLETTIDRSLSATRLDRRRHCAGLCGRIQSLGRVADHVAPSGWPPAVLSRSSRRGDATGRSGLTGRSSTRRTSRCRCSSTRRRPTPAGAPRMPQRWHERDARCPCARRCASDPGHAAVRSCASRRARGAVRPADRASEPVAVR